MVSVKGSADEATLQLLTTAQRRLRQFADSGDKDAERKAAVALADAGNCLVALGRLEEAASAYEESITRARSIKDHRQIAVAKAQLGTVKMLQKRFGDALSIYEEGRKQFEALNEPRQVAAIWHQIAIVHEKAGRFEPAEKAYRQSLAIEVRENNTVGQADTLHQLGNLCDAQERLEEAATFFRQSIERYVKLRNAIDEGLSRNNLANTLIKLQRYEEARQEIERAIECRKPYGHAVKLWTSWAILEELEKATDNQYAALAARDQAIQNYLAYRRDGGVSETQTAQLMTLVEQSIQQNQTQQVDELLTNIASEPDTPSFVSSLFAKLKAILAGTRDTTLAADPDLQYRDAAELVLLLDSLSKS